ncbi:MAG: homoserine O-acetyltransferase MetX [Spirochaetota bacterium]
MSSRDSVGIVEPRQVTFEEPFRLDCGQDFRPITVAYETYGSLNEAKSNAILVAHAFSGDAHAAGHYRESGGPPGWWDHMIGPGKAFDTEKYFVICSNVLGGCGGTTGPGSIDPETGKPYALSFPVVTIEDMVRVQARLLDHLGINRLLAVAGGSMGGMQAIEWTASYPGRVKGAIVLAATARLSAQAIAFNAVGRNAIMSDPKWNNGEYYGGEQPARGLSIARMVGHITYLSDQSMGMKFGRKLQERERFGFDFSDQFAVESYLEHQGDKFVDRFDANSYIYLTKAIDYYDLAARYGSLEDAFSKVRARFLVMSFSSDWLYPSYQAKEIVFSLTKCGKDVSYTEISSPYGHDSFLLESERQTPLIAAFLEHTYAIS